MSKNRVALALVPALALATACVEQEESKPTPEDLAYVKQNLLTSEPAPKFKVNGDFDGKVIYLGCDLSVDELVPGQDATVVHYWKVVEAPGEGWRMFTHVNGPNLQGFINFDHPPVRGKYPVSSWKAGEIIRDEHGLRLPPTWAHDKAELYVGIWKGNLRMPVKAGPQDGQNRLLAASIKVKGKQPPIERKYVVRQVKKGPKLDGKLDDAAWKDVPTGGTFVNTMTGAPVRQSTEVKMVYDDKFLYIAFESRDDDVWGDMKSRDDKLWQQEAVEVMIDPEGDGRGYVEFQVSPRGTLFDTYLPEYRKYEDTLDPKSKPFSWNSGLKAGVTVDGTLDDRDDTDKGWVAEVAIPLADAFGMAGPPKDGKLPPAYGSTWRINLFRLDQTKQGAQEAQGWSPPMVGDFHKLDRFGTILFANDKGEVPAKAAAVDPKAPVPTAAQRLEKVGKALQEMKAGVGGPASGGKLEIAQPAKTATP